MVYSEDSLCQSTLEQHHDQLLTKCYLLACDAVALDRQGSVDAATEGYRKVIKMCHELLDMEQTHRDELEQKLDKYVHRLDQLSRLQQASVYTKKTLSDAQENIKADAATNNNNNKSEESEEESEEEWEADIRFSLAKAQFAMDQAEVNEKKGFTEEALDYYSDAAELFLSSYRGLPESHSKRLPARRSFEAALTKAEVFKTMQKTKALNLETLFAFPQSIVDGTVTHDDPILTQRLSANEIDVLKHTSNVNSKIFLPWIDSSDLKEKFSFDTKFIDPEGSLKLSDKQLRSFGGWKRPLDFMKHPQLIRLISSTSIIQDIVTDCSFVASLCVAAAYEQKFKKQLITSCIYPQNIQGEPCYNPNGKYVVKLVYNGIARKIVVDDLLPMSRQGTLMCTFSSNKEELWASIIEKAYMKLMGGYDFPGSNSGIDLHCLTGWIPEHLFIHDSKHFSADKVWNRILDGTKYGDVLVTIATGEMAIEEANTMGLVVTHAYAVIDIKVVMGQRFMQVKNPWSHQRWKGPYSHLDTTHWTSELKEALHYDPLIAAQKDDGIFWIDFESVCSYFTSIHLNWNPELFTHRWVLHSVWPEEIGPKKDIYNLGYNPQFHLRVNVPDHKVATVWLLLSKHIRVTEENIDYITLHVYNNSNGERVFYPGEPFKEGTYINSPHILVRFNASPGISNYTIVVSQHEKSRSLYFSLRAYSLAPIQLTEVPMLYSIEKKVYGEWTEQTAGGNASHASFLHNPQWKVTVPAPQSTRGSNGFLLMLEAPKSFAVHLQVIEGGNRVSSVSTREIVVDSGPYRHGFSYCILECLQATSYTVIASTFEPELLGQFILTVASNTQLQVDSIPGEGAGMFRKVIHGEWICGYNAMGCPSYGNYSKNPRYLLHVRELTTVKVRLQTKITPTPSINVTLYEKHPKDVFGQEVATSGPYTNVIQGIATNNVALSQNETGYLVVFATHESNIAGEFTATFYSDCPITVRKDS